MDQNLQVLLILLSVALVVGLGAFVARSATLRKYGLLGALRRRLSGGGEHSPYEG